MHEFVVAQGGDAHLEADAGDAAQVFVHLEELGCYGLGIADQQCAPGTAEGFELAAGDRWPAALFADLAESVAIGRPERFERLRARVGKKTNRVNAHREFVGSVAGFTPGLGDSSLNIRSGRIQPPAPLPEETPAALAAICASWGYPHPESEPSSVG